MFNTHTMKKQLLLLPLMIITAGSFLHAQEMLTRIPCNPQLRDARPVFGQKSGDRGDTPLTLPFTDDFSLPGPYPDSSRWSDRNAYVNWNFGVRPPTVGMATLDATDYRGRIYAHGLKTAFPADTMTSRPIRTDSVFTPIARALTPSDSIYFSFYYQPGGGLRDHPWEGLGDAPEGSDSLILEFGYLTGDSVPTPDSTGLIPEIRWKNVWSAGGMPLDKFISTHHLDSTVLFRQVMIPLTDTVFFNKGFRFRFRNLASLEYTDENPTWAGNVDFWNIDYVRLDRGRSRSDTFIDDIAIAENPGSLLQKYESMPWRHFSAAELKPALHPLLINLSNATKNASYQYRITNPEGQVVGSYDGGSYNIEHYLRTGYQQYAPHAHASLGSVQLASSADTVDFCVLHIHKEAGSGDRNPYNDTVRFIQRFRNYFAYDDGTPEAGYTVVDIDTYHTAMALKFTLNSPDTLRAVSMFINSVLNNANSFGFTLCVWGDRNDMPGELLYSQNVSQTDEPGIYDFQLFYLDQPVAVSGNFYIGYELQGRDFLNIGFDQNSNHSGEIRYFSGNKWHSSFLCGTPMIRPFVGDGWNPLPSGASGYGTAETLELYPNPAHSTLHIRLPASMTAGDATMEVVSLSGQLLYRGAFSRTLSTEQLPAGMYMIRIAGERHTLQGKFIVR